MTTSKSTRLRNGTHNRIPGTVPAVASLKVGVQLCQENTSIGALRAAWSHADELGVDSIWLWDHFFPLSGDGSGAHFEGWTLLAAMATETRKADLGVLVSANPYRNPDLLADMARTVDHLSGGRAILGIGAGWSRRDHAAYGYELGTRAARMRALEESLQRIRRRLAALDPGPLGELPILVGGGGEKVTLRLVAEHAQLWNLAAPPERFASKNRVLDDWCRQIGRDPAEIGRTVLLPSPTAVASLDRYIQAGAEHVIVDLRHPFDLGIVERVIESARGTVLPLQSELEV
jgi:probable F420-dependent oxidoreductase